MPQRRPIPQMYRYGRGEVDLTRNMGKATRYSIEETVKVHNRKFKELERRGA